MKPEFILQEESRASDVTPVVFESENHQLIGVIHNVEKPLGEAGVLILVGGPQYRVGSHRQFLLLARHLASIGIPAMRFDYRGMGDSEGEPVGFEHCHADILAALDAFFNVSPEMARVVVWGLCDAASTIALHAHRDSRIAGLVLLNPWVRSDAGLAKTYIKHYYLKRIVSREFWRKIFNGNMNIREVTRSVSQNIRLASGGRNDAGSSDSGGELEARMHDGLSAFNGPTQFILCGQDLTALEFEEVVANSKQWKRFMQSPNVTVHRLADANHTFSRSRWRDQVFNWTVDFVASI